MNNYLEINMSALCLNAKSVCDHVGVPVIGVVKCNGYGMSLAAAAAAWQSAGVKMLAVSDPREAENLRENGFCGEILLLSPVADAEDLRKMIEKRIILTVSGINTARFYAARANGVPLRVHVAIDTGMGRFGVRWNDFEQLKAVYSMPYFIFEGIFSHFSSSFEKKYRLTKQQLERFIYTADMLACHGISVGIRHIANSCAALRFPETRLDAVRIGSALTGVLCTETEVVLQKAWRFKARVVDIKHLAKGDTVGYGSVCRIKRNIKAVVAAIGYESGFGYAKPPYNLGLFNRMSFAVKLFLQRPYAVFKGARLPLVGRVGSQYTLFDATGTDIKIGDTVAADVPLFFYRDTNIPS